MPREHERALFTDRDEILAALHRNAELIQQGKGVNLAMVGQWRIGKTISRSFVEADGRQVEGSGRVLDAASLQTIVD